MQAVEVTIMVAEDGAIEIADLPVLVPGKHKALLVVDQVAAPSVKRSQIEPLELKMLDWSTWPSNSTFRREELYDDDGR